MTATRDSPTPARERAARAICQVRRLPENVTFDGAPLWERFLPEVDAVIEALGWEDGTDGGGQFQARFHEGPIRATGNPKKEVIAQEVRALLKAAGRPLSRKELFKKLTDNGFSIRGTNPEMVLSTMIWRTAGDFGIERLDTGGYALRSWRLGPSPDEGALHGSGEKPHNMLD